VSDSLDLSQTDLLGFPLMVNSLTLAGIAPAKPSGPSRSPLRSIDLCFKGRVTASIAGGRFRADRVLGRLDVRRVLERERLFCHVSCIPRGRGDVGGAEKGI
jgi:hypothetical protein